MPTEEGQKLRHACSTCTRAFGSKRDLIKHQYMHREKPQLVCSHCNKTFVTESNYRRHLNSIQNNERKRYSCNNCGAAFRRLKDLELHHDSEHRDDKVFRCGVCQAEFSWRENLLKHEQVHDINPHVCGTCGRKFVDLTSLLVHKRTHHTNSKADPRAKSAEAMVEVDTKPPVDDEKPYTCHICGRGFRFDFSYQAHLSGHVIPEGSDVKEHSDLREQPVNSKAKSVYVQMDSEGIIDLPALNNDEVEIIVEVGNVVPSGSISISSIDQAVISSGAENVDVETAGVEKSLEDNSNDEQIKEEDSGKIITFYEPDKKDESGILPNAATRPNIGDPSATLLPTPTSYVPQRPYSSRPKKPPKRRREGTPFQFNCIMTDDKPFVCSTCGEAFRWEISLQVHTKAHTDGKVPGIRKMYMSGRSTAKRAVRRSDSAQESSVKRSRIVYQRHSSEEEEEEEEDTEDAYAFRNEKEDKAALLSYNPAKKFAQKKFAVESADDMLQEYLAGDDFGSEEESDDDTKPETADNYDGTKCQNENNLKKGKAILRKKRMWRVVKFKPPVDSQSSEADRYKSEGDPEETKPSEQIDCNVDCSQSFAVCVETDAKDSIEPHFGVVGPCLVATFPFDVTAVVDDNRIAMAAVVNDDRIAMAAAYSAEPTAVPVVIQNGFKQEKILTNGDRLTVLQYLPIQNASIEMEDAILNSSAAQTVDASAETEQGTLRELGALVLSGNSEITTGTGSTEMEESSVGISISHIPSDVDVVGACVNQIAESALSRPTDSRSTRVIFFADESLNDDVKVEEPPSSDASFGGQTEELKAVTTLDEVGMSSMNQKINAGLVALKAIVSGARSVNPKTEPNFLENPASKSDDPQKIGCVDTPNDSGEATTGAQSGNSVQSATEKMGRTTQKSNNIPRRAQSKISDATRGSHHCARCGKLFNRRASYFRHLKRHRCMKLNYKSCTQCARKFLSKASLERHATIHEALAPTSA